MPHANGKLVVEVETQDPTDCVEMLRDLDASTDIIDTPEYPDDPHPDQLAQGLEVNISGHDYRWHYGSLGLSVGFEPKKYNDRTDLKTVQKRAEELSEFAEVVRTETDRDCESYMTVVTV